MLPVHRLAGLSCVLQRMPCNTHSECSCQTPACICRSQVWTAPPINGLRGFFDGLTNILFTFGGHFMLVEVLDSMFRPARFHKVP